MFRQRTQVGDSYEYFLLPELLAKVILPFLWRTFWLLSCKVAVRAVLFCQRGASLLIGQRRKYSQPAIHVERYDTYDILPYAPGSRCKLNAWYLVNILRCALFIYVT